MHRRHRAIVIPTQRSRTSWVSVLAGAALLSGVSLAGVLVGLRLLDPVGAEPSRQAGMVTEPLMLDAPAAGAEVLPGKSSPAAAPAAPRSVRQPAAPAATVPAPVTPACRDCGVVESVEKRVRSAPTSGVGAVAGGVVGGLLGNQFGKGDGRRAMTVVGAVGGGVLGHEIEKKQRSHTEYLVRVRMADGNLRERVHARPLAIGSSVRLGEQGLQPLEAAP